MHRETRERTLPAGRGRQRWMIAALLAAAAVFVILLQLEKQQLAPYERAPVWVTTEALERGQIISEKMSWAECRMMEKTMIPDNALETIEDLTGCQVEYDIQKGTVLTRGMLAVPDERMKEMKQPVILGIKGDDAAALAGGILRAGDRVHLYTLVDENVRVWENLWVQQAFDQSGERIDPNDRSRTAQRINIYMEKEEVLELLQQIEKGGIRAAQICAE